MRGMSWIGTSALDGSGSLHHRFRSVRRAACVLSSDLYVIITRYMDGSVGWQLTRLSRLQRARPKLPKLAISNGLVRRTSSSRLIRMAFRLHNFEGTNLSCRVQTYHLEKCFFIPFRKIKNGKIEKILNKLQE